MEYKPSPEQFRVLMDDMRKALEGEYQIPDGINLLRPKIPKTPNAPSGRVWLNGMIRSLNDKAPNQ